MSGVRRLVGELRRGFRRGFRYEMKQNGESTDVKLPPLVNKVNKLAIRSSFQTSYFVSTVRYLRILSDVSYSDRFRRCTLSTKVTAVAAELASPVC
ncbi:hypothetical protein Q31b_49640 [Novipirellula aureliae]|uniref:Uncharacterized protein n=1 Tax=Novipirellula aureliae TaxID=2527966 RepID=A0A5C6DJA8_9BACT|nr:hypothetical protein Q31b_49640 [Novipirellula aureliae]